MLSSDLLAHFTDLARPDGRAAAASALARYLGAEDLLVFVGTPEVQALLPAAGPEQPLPAEHAWRAFVQRCAQERDGRGELPFPDAATVRRAVGVAADDGSVLVLLGGEPRADDVAAVRPLLPLVAAVLRAERRAIAGEGQAAAARAVATQSAGLAATLAHAQTQLQAALHEARGTDRQREALLRETQERAQHAELGAAVGKALTDKNALPAQLQRCAAAMVACLHAAFARIWTLNPADNVLELQASAGQYTHLDGPHGRVPVGAFKIGRIAASGCAHLTNDVQHDPQIGDPAWASREGMAAFAGYPLRVDDRTVGVAALFAREPLPDATLQALASVADQIAVAIDRARAEHDRERLFAAAQAAQAEVEAQRDRYRLVARATNDVIWDWDFATDQVQWSEAVQTQFGHAADRVGPDAAWWLAQIHPDDRARVADGIHAVIDGAGETWSDEYKFRRGDGTYASVLDRGHVARDAAGRAVRMIGSMLDLTDRERAKQEREALIASLARSNQELDQFAYVASHDLKAPLRGIANLSQWIEEDLADRMTDDAREQMRLLRGRVHRLEALIDGILSYSRAGRTREKPAAIDVGALLRDAVELLAPPPGATIAIVPPMPTIAAERVPLEQVFMNLVGNALKYANRPDPRVEVRARDAGTHWEFAVADNGPGIAPEFHARIWGIFQTLEARDKVEGTGIGLSVVQKVVETRGGCAWVESAVGAGATFYFTLPKHPPGA